MRKQHKSLWGPDDVVLMIIITGCFVLIGFGRDGPIVDTLKISIGIVTGRYMMRSKKEE